MDFLLGTTCWHVVGYLNDDPWKPALLCKVPMGENTGPGGSALDVIASDMKVCGNCDRATHGEARRWVADVLAETQRREALV